MAARKKKSEESLLERAAVLGSGLVYLGKGTADDVIDELENRGLLSGKKGKKVAEKIRSEVRGKRDSARKMAVSELQKVIKELGIATKDDIKKLKK